MWSHVLATVGLLGALAAQEETPKQLASRIARLLDRLEHGRVGDPASDALRDIGSPVVPHIIHRLAAARVDTVEAHMPLLTVLWRLGPKAGPATPALLEFFGKTREVNVFKTLFLLAEIAPHADAETRKSLANHALLTWPPPNADAKTRRLPAFRLTWMLERHRLRERLRVDVHAPIAELLAELKADRLFRREVVADALLARGAEARSAIPQLLAAIRGKDPNKPEVRTLRLFGSRHQFADQFTHRAMETLMQIAPRDPRIAPVWIWRLHSHEVPTARAKAAHALAKLTKPPKSVAPALRKALEDETVIVRTAVVTAMTGIGRFAASDKKRLEAWSRSKHAPLAEAAKRALQTIEDDDERRR